MWQITETTMVVHAEFYNECAGNEHSKLNKEAYYMNFPINKALLELRHIIPDYLLAVQDNRKGQYLDIGIDDDGIFIACYDRTGKHIRIECRGNGRVTVRNKEKQAFFSLPNSDHGIVCFIARSATMQRDFAEMLRKEFDFDIDEIELNPVHCVFN